MEVNCKNQDATSELPVFMVHVSCMTFNHAQYITDTMNGFCMQKTTFPFLCTIFDDASTDGGQDVIKEYLNQYFDLEDHLVVKKEETADYSLLFTRHLENKNCYFLVVFLKYNHYSIGRKDQKLDYIKKWTEQVTYIALCEGDDYWTDPYKLQKQVDALEAHPECSICFGKVSTVTRDGEPLERIYPNRVIPDFFSLDDFIKWEFLEGSWVFHTSCFVYRKKFLSSYEEALKNEFANFPYGDISIQLHWLKYGLGCFIPDFFSCYRVLSGGYNSYVAENVVFAIAEDERKILGLKDYDKATCLKYHKELNNAILAVELRNEKRKHHFFGFFNPKFIELYKNRGLASFFITFLDYYFPLVLNCLVRIKHKICR